MFRRQRKFRQNVKLETLKNVFGHEKRSFQTTVRYLASTEARPDSVAPITVVCLTRPREPRSTHGTRRARELVQSRESRKRIGGSRGYRLHSPFHRASVPSGPVTIGGAISREIEHAARLYSSEVEARPGRLLNSSRSALLHHGCTPPFAALLSNGKQPCLQRKRKRERERERERERGVPVFNSIKNKPAPRNYPRYQRRSLARYTPICDGLPVKSLA